MKIIVTGAAGLIGSHLTDQLLADGHTVIAVDNLSFGNRSNCNFTIEDIDLTTPNCLDKFKNIDVVCHLAAYKKAPKNSIASSDVMKVNFKMMDNILEYCSNTDTKLLFTSTSDIYGNSNTFTEDEPITIGPPNVERYSYALSKLHDEQMVLNMVAEKKLHATIARIFGCASPRSNKGWSGGHIPMFVDKALRGEDIVIHGDGSQTRSMSHALDIVNGLASMVDQIGNLNGEIYNLGTDEEMSVKEAAEIILEKTNSTSNLIFQPQKEAFGNYREITRRFANTSKAKEKFGYKVNYTSTEVIEEIIEVFRNENSSTNPN
jgi:UDP-glucose 4-epimerase